MGYGEVDLFIYRLEMIWKGLFYNALHGTATRDIVMDQNVWKTMFLSPRPAWSFSMRSLDNGTVEQFLFANKKCAPMYTCFSPVHILRRSCHEHVLWCCCNFGNWHDRADGVKLNNSVGVPRRAISLDHESWRGGQMGNGRRICFSTPLFSCRN